MIAQQEKEIDTESEVINSYSFKRIPKAKNNKLGSKLIKSIITPFKYLEAVALTQQEKYAAKELEILDFFKTKDSFKEKRKKLIKDIFKYVINPLMYLQIMSLVAFCATMLQYCENRKNEGEQIFNQFNAYKENVKNKNYKEANYSLNSLLTTQTGIANMLGLALVKQNVFFQESDNPLPESFIKENLNLVEKYHNFGINASIQKTADFKPCSKYDPGCNIMYSVFKTSFEAYEKREKELITESYYELTHIAEYKKYYAIPVEKRVNIKSPYKLLTE
jgi:hypothetical protein